MDRVAFGRRSARWVESSLFALAAAAPLPAAAFAFADGAEGTPCSLNAWSFVSTGPVAGGPYDAAPVVRYSGGCAVRMAGGGSPRSDHPANEATYRARFHIFPQTTGGAVAVFQARASGGSPQFSIAHDGASGTFLVYIGPNAAGPPDTTIAGAPSFRWYSVEVHYQSGQKLGVTVRGAGASTPLAAVTSSAPVLASSIDDAMLGWLATANGVPTGAINFDAFESNNLAAPIGPLCRGDVDGDDDIDGVDYKVLTDEILRRDVANGQPDCSEDGKLDVSDRLCVAKRAGTCP